VKNPRDIACERKLLKAQDMPKYKSHLTTWETTKLKKQDNETNSNQQVKHHPNPKHLSTK